MSMDLNDYTIIKEGEAEILMHAKNEVFYNKTQVNNRDMSTAVLRTFILRRKQEHEALLSKRNKSAANVPEKNALISDIDNKTNGSDMNTKKSNEECEEPGEKPEEEPCTTSEEPVKKEGKVQGEVKPPRVLEALSASGLRALRYAREVEGIGQALENDEGAVEACQRNIKFSVQSVADGGMLMCTATDMAVLCGANGEIWILSIDREILPRL
ncbi:putative tRNA (guanine(26)-N(2))-dimethyltransferase 1 [Hibiscus syriacus]|uniref:tRNA (guanine(26)-N(2))-dimethyltransferase n=1 Tax=Hibiscus syriacus TaxID=106335 RepID=A0A6A2Z3G0_HIBSY|nr:putative tRNA (guanine(26)-N(2))-dimethyltransferase 1 [Hibiscus syriacus]